MSAPLNSQVTQPGFSFASGQSSQGGLLGGLATSPAAMGTDPMGGFSFTGGLLGGVPGGFSFTGSPLGIPVIPRAFGIGTGIDVQEFGRLQQVF